MATETSTRRELAAAEVRAAARACDGVRLKAACAAYQVACDWDDAALEESRRRRTDSLAHELGALW